MAGATLSSGGDYDLVTMFDDLDDIVHGARP
jgi:hypothetical protein